MGQRVDMVTVLDHGAIAGGRGVLVCLFDFDYNRIVDDEACHGRGWVGEVSQHQALHQEERILGCERGRERGRFHRLCHT